MYIVRFIFLPKRQNFSMVFFFIIIIIRPYNNIIHYNNGYTYFFIYFLVQVFEGVKFQKSFIKIIVFPSVGPIRGFFDIFFPSVLIIITRIFYTRRFLLQDITLYVILYIIILPYVYLLYIVSNTRVISSFLLQCRYIGWLFS